MQVVISMRKIVGLHDINLNAKIIVVLVLILFCFFTKAVNNSIFAPMGQKYQINEFYLNWFAETIPDTGQLYSFIEEGNKEKLRELLRKCPYAYYLDGNKLNIRLGLIYKIYGTALEVCGVPCQTFTTDDSTVIKWNNHITFKTALYDDIHFDFRREIISIVLLGFMFGLLLKKLLVIHYRDDAARKSWAAYFFISGLMAFFLFVELVLLVIYCGGRHWMSTENIERNIITGKAVYKDLLTQTNGLRVLADEDMPVRGVQKMFVCNDENFPCKYIRFDLNSFNYLFYAPEMTSQKTRALNSMMSFEQIDDDFWFGSYYGLSKKSNFLGDIIFGLIISQILILVAVAVSLVIEKTKNSKSDHGEQEI